LVAQTRGFGKPKTVSVYVSVHFRVWALGSDNLCRRLTGYTCPISFTSVRKLNWFGYLCIQERAAQHYGQIHDNLGSLTFLGRFISLLSLKSYASLPWQYTCNFLSHYNYNASMESCWITITTRVWKAVGSFCLALLLKKPQLKGLRILSMFCFAYINLILY
jgi:hypothetical protein